MTSLQNHKPLVSSYASIREEDWRDYSENQDKTKLITGISLLGVDHWIEAIEVVTIDGIQQVVNPTHSDYFEDLCNTFELDGAYAEVIINDRHYVLFMCPSKDLS